MHAASVENRISIEPVIKAESQEIVASRVQSSANLKPSDDATSRLSIAVWLPLVAGLLVMYAGSYLNLWNTVWQSEDQAHGPIILAIVLWLFWQMRVQLLSLPPAASNTLGWPLLVIGLAVFVIGRSQDLLLLDAGSQILVLAALLLLFLGADAIKIAWFPLLYIIFMIPVPGVIVDALTGPLKQYISVIAETVLYAFGYPIGRQGVVLHIGQYQLLVADACSGLHSMFSLSALGLLFMYLTKRESWLHNGIMLASILPIAFVANVIRVMILILVTYYLGDEAGQGFLHGTAGIVLLLAALLFLFLIDWSLSRIIRPTRGATKP